MDSIMSNLVQTTNAMIFIFILKFSILVYRMIINRYEYTHKRMVGIKSCKNILNEIMMIHVKIRQKINSYLVM